MKKSTTRDIEKTYSKSEFIKKLRRFADALEADKKFLFKLLMKGLAFLKMQLLILSMREEKKMRKLSSR